MIVSVIVEVVRKLGVAMIVVIAPLCPLMFTPLVLTPVPVFPAFILAILMPS